MKATGPLLLAGGLAALAGWMIWRERCARADRGGAPVRHLLPAATRRTPLSEAIGQITPDHLAHYGPTVLPAHWVAHKVRYSPTPGAELQRLIYGAPGAVDCTVPRAQRGWLYAPPSEMDY